MLEGKVALVTGGAAGIGAAISRLFYSQGARIAVASNQPPDELERFCRELDPTGTAVAAIHCDLALPAAIDALLAQVCSRFGQIQILVNSAGVFARAPIEEMPVATMQSLVAVNLLAPMLLTRAVIALMRRQGRGNIVNIASMGATMTVEGTAVYAATKAGLVQFTKVVAGELGRSGIRLNAIAPGPTRTGMIGFGSEEITADLQAALAKRALTSRSPFGQPLLEPSQVADIAMFLVSDAASGIQGSTILADQGYSSVLSG